MPRTAAAPLAPVHRLSEGEIDRILDAAAAKREPVGVDRRGDRRASARARKFMAKSDLESGTDGYRSAFGTAVVPLDDGFAAFSFDRTNFGSTDVPFYYDRTYNR